MTKKLLGFIPLLIILLLAFAIRWWQIASVAPGISVDELDYALSAKSFFLTGSDLKNSTKTLDVLRFQYPKTDDTKAELPYLIQLPFDGPLPFSLPMTRLPFVLMSIGSVLLLYGIVKELVSKNAGIIAGVLGSINPYLVVLGRTNYEVTGAIFFFLASFYAIIKLKGWKIFLSAPLFACAFYVYIGTKVLFIPFVLLSVAFAYFYVNKRKFLQQYALLLGLLFLFFAVYFLILKATPTNRLGELLTPNSKEIIASVNSIRHTSLPGNINSFVINKFTIYLRTVVNSFFLIFSNDFLVGVGDNFFKLYNHGVMYYADIVAILASIVFFAKKKSQLGLYLLGFIIISTLPQIIHDDAGINTNYAHTALLFPFLVIAASIGIYYIFSLFSKKLLTFGIILIGAIYIVSFAFFVQAYFYQYPLHGQDDFTTRELSKYITLATEENQHVVIMSPVSALHFKKYLFYANALNKNSISQVKQIFKTSQYNLNNVSFTSCDHHPLFPKNTVVITDNICGDSDFMGHSSIALVLDGGPAYKIYNDSVCGTYSLKPYPTDLKISDFDIENMPRQMFCENFITR